MAVDANSQLFPLAFAVVESENHDSWSWFMACIRHWVTDREDLCVISDRHAGILATMKEPHSGWEYPHSHHRFCMRHLAANVQKQFKNAEVKKLFGKAASASQLRKFNKYMDKIAKISAEAKDYLLDIPLHQWSLHHDGGRRYGTRTTNMSEAFNGVMKGGRSLPITPLGQMTFYRVATYFADRREFARKRLEAGHEYSPKAQAVIDKNMEKAVHHSVFTYDHELGQFEVTTGRGNRRHGKGGRKHFVNLIAKTCTCEKMKIYRLPCSHVLAVCRERGVTYAPYVDPCFTTAEYRATYIHSFKHVPDEVDWPQYTGPKIIPDESKKRGRGRPRTTRFRNEMDVPIRRGTVSCSVCHQAGHNQRTCPSKKV